MQPPKIGGGVARGRLPQRRTTHAGRYGILCQALSRYLVEGGLGCICGAARWFVRAASKEQEGRLVCCAARPHQQGRDGRGAAPRRAGARQGEQEQSNSGQG